MGSWVDVTGRSHSLLYVTYLVGITNQIGPS